MAEFMIKAADSKYFRNEMDCCAPLLMPALRNSSHKNRVKRVQLMPQVDRYRLTMPDDMIRIKSAIGTVFAAAYKSLIVNSEGFFLISVSLLCIP